jgi:hypothetical protein
VVPFTGQCPKYVARALDAERLPIERRTVINDRKDRFAEINAMVMMAAGGAWLTSVPGEVEVRLEVLPSSDVPQRLRDLGFSLRPEGQGEC